MFSFADHLTSPVCLDLSFPLGPAARYPFGGWTIGVGLTKRITFRHLGLAVADRLSVNASNTERAAKFTVHGDRVAPWFTCPHATRDS
jgi:hypothetical protein